MSKKTIVVVGAGQGLGNHVAERFAKEDFRVVLVADDAFAEKQGVILLTGGVACLSPFPGYLCLAMDKGALRGLALAMHNELAPKGIFVGTVMVCGVIGGNEHFAPANIAEK